MEIFKNRYQAEKARKTNNDYSMADKIIKVDGGYTIMDAYIYNIWKKQK